MFRRSFILVALLTLSGLAFAQSIPDSELAARLKANRPLFSECDRGPDLVTEAQTKDQDIVRRFVVNETPMLCPDCPKPDPSDHPTVRRGAVESDLVVIARNTQNVSSLTANNAFAFTDSQMIVEQVWKADGPDIKKGSVLAGAEITVANPGDTVHANGHAIHAYLSNRLPLQVGHSYLLFLRYIPQSSTYVPAQLDGFDVTGSSVVPLRTTTASPLDEYLSSPTVFLDLMHRSTDRAANAEDAK